MSNLEKYNGAFLAALEIAEEQLGEATVESIAKWDSIGHITLINSLEDAFDIMFDADDIISFRSYEGGKEILKKYDIEL